jgi:repressor LexA
MAKFSGRPLTDTMREFRAPAKRCGNMRILALPGRRNRPAESAYGVPTHSWFHASKPTSHFFGERWFSIIVAVKKAINDHEHLAMLQSYYAEHRVLPSYARLMELLGFASKSAVKKVLERLEVAGMLERTPDGDWAPSEQFFERAIASQPVPAGMPTSADADVHEKITIDRFLIQKPNKTVLIRVKGNSMVGAGIQDGDLAVVERRTSATQGDIVVAVVDDQFTLKTLARDQDGYHLLAANPNYPVIRPNGSLEIFGVLVGLVRKYS